VVYLESYFPWRSAAVDASEVVPLEDLETQALGDRLAFEMGLGTGPSSGSWSVASLMANPTFSLLICSNDLRPLSSGDFWLPPALVVSEVAQPMLGGARLVIDRKTLA